MWSDFMHHVPDGYVTDGYRAVSYWSDAPIWLKIIANIPNNRFRRLTARLAIRSRVVVLIPDQMDFGAKDYTSIVDTKGTKMDPVTDLPADIGAVVFEASPTLRSAKLRKFGARKKRNRL